MSVLESVDMVLLSLFCSLSLTHWQTNHFIRSNFCRLEENLSVDQGQSGQVLFGLSFCF